MLNRFHAVRTLPCMLFSALLLLLSACSTKKENIPLWLLLPQEEYPAERFLVAIGEGDTRRAAENSATAGLARIFKSEIEAAETLSETAIEQNGKLDRFSELRSEIEIATDQKLLNVQFGKAYTDTRSRVYVAAFLPRAETAEIYRGKILEQARQIVFLIQQSDASADPLHAYAFRRAAVRKALENDLLIDQLDIIHPQARENLSLYYDPQTLYAEAAKAARDVTFAVDTDGPGCKALEETLTSMGFKKTFWKPILRFSCSSSFEKTDIRRGPLVFMRYRADVKMQNANEHLLLSFSDASREGHISFEEARARAERSLRRSLSELTRKELSAFFDRLATAD